MKKPIILIPARLASTRLPRKPLAMIGDAPMIVQVWRRARDGAALLETSLRNSQPARGRRTPAQLPGLPGPAEVWEQGPQSNIKLAIACDSEEIAAAVRNAGGEAVLTDPALPSGSDRIWAALAQIDPAGEHDVVINLQGDMPTLDPAIIAQVLKPLERPEVDIATLAAEITDDAERTNPNVVKVAMGYGAGGKGYEQLSSRTPYPVPRTPYPVPRTPVRRALYFSRAPIPHGEGPLYHHIGIYAYRRAALEKFVSLPPSPLERREKLEQLRALEAGMHIDVAIVDTVPLGVDTPEQLEMAQELINRHPAT